MSLVNELFCQVPYKAPSWLASNVDPDLIPESKMELGRFPTPYHKFNLDAEQCGGLDMWIKRDDLSSFDLGGNKVRKLQFLLAKAQSEGCDTIVTIGGVQSNHCRATCVASRQMGMDSYLILRTRGEKIDPPEILNDSLVGNLLFDRMVDAKIRTVTAAQYAEVGADALLQQLKEELEAQGKKPYVVPMGGSNAVGAFGYLDAVEEITRQDIQFDHLVFACGSGGTAAGLGLGARLAGIPSVHAVGVCDSPDYFYSHIEDTARALGVDMEKHGSPREWLSIHHGAGIGYGRSTDEELEFILQVSKKSGVLLDPTYSGKGLHYFLEEVVKKNPGVFQEGHKVLFLHTGGALGLYDKHEEVARLMAKQEKGINVVSMDVRLPSEA